MSSLRKRSQDARASRSLLEGADAHHVPSSTPTRFFQASKSVAAVITFGLLVLTVFLIQLYWNSTVSQDLLPNIPSLAQQGSDRIQPFQLSPDHFTSRKPTTVNYKWRITSGLGRPDGVLKRVYLINDEFPGPTIECRSGDRLVIEVENALDDEGLSMHWHGLSMRDANAMDGAVGITNVPIEPSKTFVYDFKVEDSQSGTFWYHSHLQNQRAEGLYGALIVHNPESADMGSETVEHVVAVSDWYHRSAEDAIHFFSHPGSFGNEAVPDSILLNGKGAYNCSDAVPARPLDCEVRSYTDLPAMTLDKGKKNILRIINVGSYAGIGLSAPNSRLLPLAVDGGSKIVSEYAKSVQYLQAGERVDVLIESNDDSGPEDGVLQVYLDTKPFKYPNSALTPMHRFAIQWIGHSKKAVDSKGLLEALDLQNLGAVKPQNSMLPPHADQVIVLYAITQRYAHLENTPLGFINNTSWKPQDSPLLSLQRSEWDKNQLVPRIEYDQRKPVWVDIVLNNLDEEGHPFHLHGYDFWVLSTYSSTFNWGSYNPFEDEVLPGGPYNLANPVKKDTVFVPRRGYAVLRLRADNPGLWMFHCHVMWHQATGMAMALEVS